MVAILLYSDEGTGGAVNAAGPFLAVNSQGPLDFHAEGLDLHHQEDP
jgi:hypothetical protein